jgi:hypothetical protein
MKKASFLLGLAALAVFFLFAENGFAQTKQRVSFARGTSSATLKGTVKGYAYKDYVVRASAGQQISIELDGPGNVPVFTVFLPNGDNLQSGATQVNSYTDELPETGDYVVRVGLMRAFARRGASGSYTLNISIQ